MWNAIKIALCVVLPLAWGLAVEYAFEQARRKRAARRGRRGQGP